MNDDIIRMLMASYAEATVKSMRQFGIEMTADEAEDIVRDGLKEALREFWKQRWLRRLTSAKSDDNGRRPGDDGMRRD